MFLGQGVLTWDHGMSIGILSGLGAFGWYVIHRLFDEKSGVLVKYVNDQKAFLRDLTKRHEKQLELCEVHGRGITSIVSTFEDTGEYKTVSTNKSLADMARVELIKLRSRHNIETQDKEKIIKLLSAIVERLDPESEDSGIGTHK